MEDSLPLILISKLPPELRLIVSRELSEGEWDSESMMKMRERLRQESGLQEHQLRSRKSPSGGHPPPHYR